MTTAVAAPAGPKTVATLATKTLQSALATVTPATNGKGLPDICKTVHVEASYGDDGTEPYLRLTTTNLEMGIQRTVNLASLDAEFKVCVPADRFANFVGTLVGTTVDLELVKQELVVTSHRAKAKLKTADAEDFPRFPTPKTPILACAAERLGMADRLVSDFAATDEKRPVLHGVHLYCQAGGVRWQAADGFICAIWDGFADPSVDQLEVADLIIPVNLFRELGKVAREMPRDNVVTLFTCGQPEKPTHVYLDSGTRDGESTQFTCRLMEGQAPDMQRIVPTPNASGIEVRLHADKLRSSIRRITPFAVNNITGRTILMGADAVSGLLSLRCHDADLGEAEDAIDVTVSQADAQTYAHASGNLLKVLDAMSVQGKDAEVVFYNGTPLTPALFTSPGLPGYRAVIMPMSILKTG